MLARKYYAQKGNSKGPMKTAALTPSSNQVIKNRMRSQVSNEVKVMQEFTSQKYTDRKKYETVKCSTADNTTTLDKSCSSGCEVTFKSPTGIRSNRVNYVHKDIIANSQGDYIQNVKENRSCLENDPKPEYGVCSKIV